MTYDPGLQNTISYKSRVTFVDGEKRRLEYRGYPIEQLAAKSTYLEVAFLLIIGHLPSKQQLLSWTQSITEHAFINENFKRLLEGFHYNSDPTGMLVSMLGAMSTFYPESKDIFDTGNRLKQFQRLIGQVPTLVAFCFRHRIGMQYSYPDKNLTYEGNLLGMMFKTTELLYQPHPILERCLGTMFILHADRPPDASTHALRGIGSSHADPFQALAVAIAVHSGPRQGMEPEMVIRMLKEIRVLANLADFIKKVKVGRLSLFGFGDRTYPNYDPRVESARRICHEVTDVTGVDESISIAFELERIAREDEYFICRNLFPNLAFYTGIFYQAMRFPIDMLSVMTAIPRISGWLAHWAEQIDDEEQGLIQPEQWFRGTEMRNYIDIAQRPEEY
jgi:Citrate synthase